MVTNLWYGLIKMIGMHTGGEASYTQMLTVHMSSAAIFMFLMPPAMN